MATTARSALIQAMSEEIGDYESLTASSNGTTTTIIDTGLRNLVGGGDDDAFIGWFAKITETGHASIGSVRRLSSSTASSNTLTWLEAVGTLLSSGQTFELHRIDPVLKALALNQAIERLIDDLYLPIRDETLVVDDRLSNSDFETFAASVFTGWAEVGSPTTSQETTIKLHGTQSAKVVASGAVGQLTQTVATEVHEITSKSVTFRMWVATVDANAARIRLDWDGSEIDNSTYHSGDGTTNAIQWEQLTVTAQVPSGATQIKAICEVADGSTAYFDAGYLYHVPIHRYTLPTSIVALSHVTQQADENLLDGPYLPYGWGDMPVPGRRIRIEGKNILSTMSTDTATTEIGAPQTRLLITYALGLLFRMLASPTRAGASQGDRYVTESERWFNEYETLRGRPGMKMKRLGRTKMMETAHLERDASGAYLVFDQLGRTAGPLTGSVRL